MSRSLQDELVAGDPRALSYFNIPPLAAAGPPQAQHSAAGSTARLSQPPAPPLPQASGSQPPILVQDHVMHALPTAGAAAGPHDFFVRNFVILLNLINLFN